MRVHVIGTLESTLPGTASVGACRSRVVGSGVVWAGTEPPRAPHRQTSTKRGRERSSERSSLFLHVAFAGCVCGRLPGTGATTAATTAAASGRQRRAHARAIVLHGAPRPVDALRGIRSDGPVLGPFSRQRHRNRGVARM